MGWLKCPITGIAKEVIVQLKKKSRPKRDFNYTPKPQYKLKNSMNWKFSRSIMIQTQSERDYTFKRIITVEQSPYSPTITSFFFFETHLEKIYLKETLKPSTRMLRTLTIIAMWE